VPSTGLRALIVLLLAVLVAGGSPASGNAVAGLSEAELTDLARVAGEAGIGLDEAVDRFGWQNGFALAATAIEEKFPGDFSGAEVTSESPAVATIRFKGSVPVGVEDLLSTVPSGVRVILEPGAGISASEIDELVIQAHTAVGARPEVADLASSFDRATGTVQVLAQPAAEGTTPAERAALAEEALAGLPPELRGRVSLVVDPRVDAGGDLRYGGGRLEFSSSADLACTAGFNVIAPSGATGVAMAGHCSNSMTHENTSGAAEYALAYQAQHRGDWGDFQWMTASDSEPDDFYYNWGVIRDVAARGNPMSGQTLCRFGHTTGAQCDDVADVSTCATFGGFDHCRVVRMDNDEAGIGDSGGPWYWGTTAYGFHTGHVPCGFLGLSSCDVWSRVTYIDDGLGVTVRI
jgi:hypothetical protein